MLIDDRSPVPRFDDGDASYRRYCETCRGLGVEPVPRERARELVETWSAIFESPGATRH